MPTVTVIIPVYKVERYLDACVESVVRQSYADLEILLVDDGSPDRCPALCDAWAEKDPRIKVIHRENGGLSAARNSGIDAAMGEFLLFVDSDDLLEPDAVRRAVDAQRQQDADLVIFNLTYVDEANRPLPQPDFSGFTDEILDEDGVWQRCFALAETRIYYVVAWNKLYRRSLFQHLRYAPGKRYEDQFLLPHLLAQCKTIACLAAPGYRYVQRSGSIMAQGSSRTYLDRPEYLLDWCAYFTQKGDALRAEGLLNDAIQNLAEKQCFDLSTPAQRARYRAACRACADSYTALAAATGQRSMRLRAALLRIGLPAGLQSSMFSISNVLIQSAINSFGAAAIAGNTAAASIEGFATTVSNSISQAALTFSSQNMGAEKYARVRRVLLVCLAATFVGGLTLGLLIYTFGTPLLALFNTDPAVIANGLVRVRHNMPLYVLFCMQDTFVGQLRGVGYSLLPTITSLSGICLLRVVWLYTAFAASPTLDTLYLSYPVSWAATLFALVVCYAVVVRKMPRA